MERANQLAACGPSNNTFFFFQPLPVQAFISFRPSADILICADPPPAPTCPLQRAPVCWLFPPRRWWSVPSSTAWWLEGWTSRRSWCSPGSPPRSNRWCGWSGTLVYLSDTHTGISTLTLTEAAKFLVCLEMVAPNWRLKIKVRPGEPSH